MFSTLCFVFSPVHQVRTQRQHFQVTNWSICQPTWETNLLMSLKTMLSHSTISWKLSKSKFVTMYVSVKVCYMYFIGNMGGREWYASHDEHWVFIPINWAHVLHVFVRCFFIRYSWCACRVRYSARIQESILAKILLNNVTRIQVDSHNCYFTHKLYGGESKDSPNLIARI